jgi:hypothetical protein
MTLEGIYAIVGAVSFISFLTGNADIKDVSKQQSKIIGKELFRIGVIALTNAVCVIFSIWVFYDDNYISHLAFCIIMNN